MKLIDGAVRRPVSTAMVFAAVVLLGVISLGRMRIDLLPSLGYPQLAVLAEYPGASPEEVEKLLVAPLEASLSPIAGVKRVSSVSREGLGLVTVEFHWGSDMDFALLRLKEKVEEARSLLPEDCAAPKILEMDPAAKPIVIAALEAGEGTALADLRASALSLVKPRLEQLAEVARAEVQGGGEQEALITLDPERMARYGVDFAAVAAAVSDWNQLVLGGTVTKDRIRYVVKVEGGIREVAELERIPVRTLGSRPLLLGEIGRAALTDKIRQGEVRYNRRPTVALLIYKEASGNTVEATAEVRRTLAKLEREYPGLEFAVVTEEAGLIVSAISSLKGALVQGGLLAFLVLLLFFQNLRDPLLVAVISPISVLATFVMMHLAGVHFNIMSLGGLALGIGMFMDNAIVVIENMFRLDQAGDPEQAAIDGTRELLPALLGSTLTTMVIFLPVIYIYGITGRLFRDQSLTISFALTAALLVTVTLLPSLFRVFSRKGPATPLRAGEPPETERPNRLLRAAHGLLALPFRLIGLTLGGLGALGRRAWRWLLAKSETWLRKLLDPVFRGFNRGYGAFERVYHRFLVRCLERKVIALWIALAMTGLTAAGYLVLRKELLPQTRTARFEIELETPPALGFAETADLARRVEKKLLGLDEVRSVFVRSGSAADALAGGSGASVNAASLLVECRRRGDRDRAMRAARRICASFPELRAAVAPERNTLAQYLRFGASEFRVQLFCERLEEGGRLAGELAALMRRIPGLADVRSGGGAGKPVVALRFRDDLLQELGLSRRQVAEQVRTALYGDTVASLRRFQGSTDIVVAAPPRLERDLDRLLAMKLVAGGRGVTLGEVVTLERLSAPAEIDREGQERYVTVGAALDGITSATAAARLNRALPALRLAAGARLVIAGEEEERRAAFRSVYQALLLSVVLVFMVMAAEFESLLQPLIILTTVPMGLLGAFLALLLTGESINVISGIGLMVAVGVVVDDAIVKIECANQQRALGLPVRQALLEASRLRLRPIVLNSFTTIFGVLPMIYLGGVGAELQRPMAVVMAGGLFTSTALTLILIPVLYEMVCRDRPARN